MLEFTGENPQKKAAIKSTEEMADGSDSIDAETKAARGWYPGKYLEKSSSYFRNKGAVTGLLFCL